MDRPEASIADSQDANPRHRIPSPKALPLDAASAQQGGDHEIRILLLGRTGQLERGARIGERSQEAFQRLPLG